MQVVKWRTLCGLQPDQGQIGVDSWGLKRLLSYGTRRWLTGAKAPRDSWLSFRLNLGCGDAGFTNTIDIRFTNTITEGDSNFPRTEYLMVISTAFAITPNIAIRGQYSSGPMGCV